MKFKSRKPHYEHLRKKWIARHRAIQNQLWTKHKSSLEWLGKNISPKQLALGSLGGLLLLSAPAQPTLPQPTLAQNRDDILAGFDQNIILAEQLQKILPKEVRSLGPTEESEITNILSQNFGFKVTAQIEGIRLNRNYGLIGGEQHLYRYPGDHLYAHADNTAEWAKYGSSGIAPGLGAWGYFAPSKADFSEKDKIREKYYLAIQTFLAPGFAENVGKYRDFFKYRKMLVVNPKTGQAVVAVIGDAGPAWWTGKHLGGSPEVMDILGLATGPRKGEVLYFFIDDPNDPIPLGPVTVQSKA
ncbi:hypothetical protein HYS94_02980 [Candidatus Daviesbacteria bacterium]|nr:hypothetical protein [Candidatus Daviesbacteria bacterium]MBI4036141.1 hypothetical protein [Candidatus Daviesbacteria bacterium]